MCHSAYLIHLVSLCVSFLILFFYRDIFLLSYIRESRIFLCYPNQFCDRVPVDVGRPQKLY